MPSLTTIDDQRTVLVTTVALVLLIGILIGWAALGSSDLAGSDAVGDWLVTREAFLGENAHGDPRGLARRYDVPYVAVDPGVLRPDVHPRPPGSFVLMAPMLAVRGSQAHLLMVTSSVLVLVWLAATLVRWLRPSLRAVAATSMLFLSAPVVTSFTFGTQSVVIGALVLFVWMKCRLRDDAWGGVALGAATALKLFPGLLLVPLVLKGRWRSAGAAVLVVTGLTVGGLALPGVRLGEAIHALDRAGRIWAGFAGNASLSRLLTDWGVSFRLASWMPVLAGVVLVTFLSLKWRSFDRPFAATVVIASLVAPLSWSHYDLMVLPVGLGMLGRSSELRLGARVALGLWASTLFLQWAAWTAAPETGGYLVLVGRMALLWSLSLPPAGERGWTDPFGGMRESPSPRWTVPLAGRLAGDRQHG